jgi:threonine synthase
MDIRVPSNLERFTGNPAREFEAGYAGDEQIRDTIAEVVRQHDYLLDPHTATAWFVGNSTIGDRPQVVIGTAHPAKFSEAVRQSVGHTPQPPPGFEDLADRPERSTTIAADPSVLDRLIR